MARNQEIITDETLLGFLLEVLPQDEQNRIALLKSIDTKLAQRIHDLSDLLAPRVGLSESFEPRADLTRLTMSAIADATAAQRTQGDRAMSQPFLEASRSTRLAWLDSIVALVAGIIVLCILLPSIFLSRESSRRIACATNMRELGQAIRSFAYGNPSRRVPNIEATGPLSFAGIYPMRLKDAGLLAKPNLVWCPSMEMMDLNQPIPTTIEFLKATQETRDNWRYSAGGNYCYNLGYVSDGEYLTPVLDPEVNFAIIGDTLLALELDLESALLIDIDSPTIHGRNAANILFSDGQIRYVRIDRIDTNGIDNPYLNRANEQAAGIGDDDCCLGPSHRVPIVNVRAR